MRQFTLTIAEIATIPGRVQVRCAGAAPGFAPGQAALALADSAPPPFLRAALFPYQRRPDGLEFCVEPTHPYAALMPGAKLDLLGPCGHGFELPPRAAHLLFIAAAPTRLAALLEHALARRLALTWLLPAAGPLPTGGPLPMGGSLPALPEIVELQRGPLTAELVAWADCIAIDAPDAPALLAQIHELGPRRPAGFIQTLVDTPLPCGVGACQACWVETPRGRQLACVEGPVIRW